MTATCKLTKAAGDIKTLSDNSFAVLHRFISTFYSAPYAFAPLQIGSYIPQTEIAEAAMFDAKLVMSWAWL